MEAAQLRHRWLDFHRNCGAEDRLDLGTYEPSIESVFEVVEDVRKKWESNRNQGFSGKIAKTFHKVCGTLDSHSSMLKILPEGNEYISIFTGTLTTIIRVSCHLCNPVLMNFVKLLPQASANHEKIAEGLSQSLESIGQSVAACNRDLYMFNTDMILEPVSELYRLVFVFLSAFMDYFMKKRRYRFLDSFNEDLEQKFKSEVSAIHQKAEQIRRMVEQGSRAEVRETRVNLDALKTGFAGMQRDVRMGLLADERHREELEHNGALLIEQIRHLNRKQEQIDLSIMRLTQTLRENAASNIHGRQMATSYIQEQDTTDGRISPYQLALIDSGSGSKPSIRQWVADDVALNSANLEDFFYRDRIRLQYEPTGRIMASQEVLNRLADWTGSQSTESAFLWLDGPPMTGQDLDNPLTMVAVNFVNLASTSEVPVISHFCERRRGDALRSGNTCLEVQGVIGLLYSLARQMIDLLLEVRLIETEKDLSEERFRMMDGSAASWAHALALFQDLVELVPYKVFCVIDGMHWIDDSSSSVFVQDLLKALRNDKFKVLFTTSGRSPSLREHLGRGEAYRVERPETRRTSAGLRAVTFGGR